MKRKQKHTKQDKENLQYEDDFGLPGPIITDEQLEKALSKPTGRAVSLKTAKKLVLKHLASLRK